jgi:hypothetical protein
MKHLYIIADTDSCSTFDSSICSICPLAKLKQREDGSYMSCIEVVSFTKEKDGSYAKAAFDILLKEILIED